MRTFQLKSGTDTFTLGDGGSVTLAGAAAGKWTTAIPSTLVRTGASRSGAKLTTVGSTSSSRERPEATYVREVSTPPPTLDESRG